MLSVYEIGEKIAVARKLKNLSQAQLAEYLAVSAQAVGKWERGESMPDIITFGRLAEVLGVELNYFAEAQSMPVPAPTVRDEATAEEEESSQRPGWNMSGANWTEADFSGLSGLAERFRGANIENCRFAESELSGLTLKGNNIVGSDFLRSILAGSKFTNSNLENSIFSFCNLKKSEFIRSNIKNSDISGADLTDAVFKWSNIQKVNFSETVFRGTAFRYSQFTDIVFGGEVRSCSFENCDFTRVQFDGATFRDSFFKNCKLKRAKFLACKADRITLAFLKACKADTSGIEIID